MESAVKYSRIILFITGVVLVCICMFNLNRISLNSSIKILMCLIIDIITLYLYLVLDLVYVKAYNGKKNTGIRVTVIILFIVCLYCIYMFIDNPGYLKFNICYYFNINF